jgi:hypothetical protein
MQRKKERKKERNTTLLLITDVQFLYSCRTGNKVQIKWNCKTSDRTKVAQNQFSIMFSSMETGMNTVNYGLDFLCVWKLYQ